MLNSEHILCVVLKLATDDYKNPMKNYIKTTAEINSLKKPTLKRNNKNLKTNKKPISSEKVAIWLKQQQQQEQDEIKEPVI